MVLTPTTYGTSGYAPGMTTDVPRPDLVVGGGMKLVTSNRTITGGLAYKRGTVMGRITSGPKAGAFTIATAAANDGSQVPWAILSDDTLTSDGDVTSGLYMQGEFFESAILVGIGFTIATARDALERRGIYLKASMAGE